MCIFSKEIKSVSNTNIFCRALPDGRHCTIYSMEVGLIKDTAMILPTPTTPSREPITFINLEIYRNFFTDMKKMFPESLGRGRGLGGAKSLNPTLPIHDVGDYVASCVPTIKDFERLDELFRLPTDVWDKLPNYKDFSFAVFQLKRDAAATNQRYHPMAYTYTPIKPNELFYPTTHVHDEKVPKAARYDHTLYYQTGNGFGTLNPLQPPEDPTKAVVFTTASKSEFLPRECMDIKATAGLVDPQLSVERLKLTKYTKNGDHKMIGSNTESTAEFSPAITGV